MVPLNLTAPASTTDYLDTGHWSKKAIEEARRYCAVRVAGEWGAAIGGRPRGRRCARAHLRVPPQSELTLDPRAAYVHYTPNETISGVEFCYIPQTRGVPLIADMSSNILSRPLDVSKFGLIYAGAQKNIGPAGLTVVIVREDLLGRARPETPSVFNYQAVAESHSMLNTPPTFAWYVAGLVFKWLKKNGGLAAMGERNRGKAGRLYAAIDGSALYRNRVAEDSRSWMNVTFTLNKPGSGGRLPRRGGGGGPAQPQGSSGPRRHAREPLQCHAARRRRRRSSGSCAISSAGTCEVGAWQLVEARKRAKSTLPGRERARRRRRRIRGAGRGGRRAGAEGRRASRRFRPRQHPRAHRCDRCADPCAAQRAGTLRAAGRNLEVRDRQGGRFLPAGARGGGVAQGAQAQSRSAAR